MPINGCEEARIRGNDAFTRTEWDVAIAAYGAGISAGASAGLSPDYRLFSNRSAAYLSKYLDVRKAGLDLRGLLALAVNDAMAATAMKPSSSKAWFRLIVAHIVDRNIINANIALKEGLSHCPNDPDLCRAAVIMNPRNEDSVDAVNRNVSARPGEPERRVADAALRSGDFTSAIMWYTHSINHAVYSGLQPDRRSFSNRSVAWLQIATSTDREDAFAAAVADADRCISIDDLWPKAWYRKGSAYLEDGRPGFAKNVFERALRRCPSDGELRTGLYDSRRILEKECSGSDLKENFDLDIRCEMKPLARTTQVYGSEDARYFTESKRDQGSVTELGNESESSSLSECVLIHGCTQSKQEIDFSSTLKTQAGYHSNRQKNDCNPKCKISSDFEAQDESIPFSSRSLYYNVTPVGSSRVPFPDSQPAARRLKSTLNVTVGHLSNLCDNSSNVRSMLHLRSSNGDAKDIHSSDNPFCGTSAYNLQPQTVEEAEVVTLYELLGVVQTADENEIKKAYYNLARRLHPDKNQRDPEATEKFQQLVNAYRVLSNSKSRAIYDKYGKYELARKDLCSVDPTALFSMVFGSDHFGHLIGELQVASLANAVDENGNAPSSEILDRIQKERVGKLAVHLIRMLEPWVTGRQIEFMDWAVSEARRLSSANFGTQLLHVVGRAYCAGSAFTKIGSSTRRGARALPAAISSVLADGMYRTKRARAQLRASAAANRVLAKQRRAHDCVLRLSRGGKSLTAAQSERMAIEMAECAVDMMWKLAVVDIETTIADVVAAALSCKDVSPENESIVNSRANAILVLGRAFSNARS